MQIWKPDDYSIITGYARGKVIASLIPEGTKTIIDIGCGKGIIDRVICKKYPDIICTCVDMSTFPEWESPLDNLKFRQQTIQDLVLQNEYYDLALTLETWRNWLSESNFPVRDSLAVWIRSHCKYWIKTIGMDAALGPNERLIGIDNCSTEGHGSSPIVLEEVQYD